MKKEKKDNKINTYAMHTLKENTRVNVGCVLVLPVAFRSDDVKCISMRLVSGYEVFSKILCTNSINLSKQIECVQ